MELETKLARLMTFHRQRVFNDHEGEAHMRALRRLKRTQTFKAMVERNRAEQEHRASERLLRLWA